MTGRRRWDDQAAALVSWPGLARPPTPGGADTAKGVDGRHKPALGRAKGPARGAGHDTGASGPALSAPRRTSRAMTGRCGRCVSTKLRLAVAQHCAAAGLAEQAVTYWLKAGRQALARSAMAEAVVQLRKGLDLLTGLPDNPWRRQQELDLLNRVQFGTVGFPSWPRIPPF